MRSVALEMGYVDNAMNVWHRAIQARKTKLQLTADNILVHRDTAERTARNKTIQVPQLLPTISMFFFCVYRVWKRHLLFTVFFPHLP